MKKTSKGMDLRPCGCGGTAKMVAVQAGYYVRCKLCGISTMYGSAPELVAMVWNRAMPGQAGENTGPRVKPGMTE